MLEWPSADNRLCRGVRMAKDIDRISLRIATSRAFDGYSAWRMLKSIDHEIEALGTSNAPVPIELARLRSIIARARALRRRRPPSAEPALAEARAEPATRRCRFDMADFVDRYRALGGRRLALDLGAEIEIRQWDRDTDEAAELWEAMWRRATPAEREVLAIALLWRGRF